MARQAGRRLEHPPAVGQIALGQAGPGFGEVRHRPLVHHLALGQALRLGRERFRLRLEQRRKRLALTRRHLGQRVGGDVFEVRLVMRLAANLDHFFQPGEVGAAMRRRPAIADVAHVEQIKQPLLRRRGIDDVVEQTGDDAGCLQVNEQPRNLHPHFRRFLRGGDDFLGDRVAIARAAAAHSREGQLIRP